MTYTEALYILSDGKPIPSDVRKTCIVVLAEAVAKARSYDSLKEHKVGTDITAKFVKSHIDKAIWNLKCARTLDEDSVDADIIRIIETYV